MSTKFQTKIIKEIAKCKHPSSRKTKALAKKVKKMNNRTKTKLGNAMKSNFMGERLGWFAEKTNESTTPLSSNQFQELIEEYLQRFDEELVQINLKQSISKNRSNQHASRKKIIEMSKERESNEFKGAGLEIMNLCNGLQFESFKSWDGNAMNIQHLKIERVSKSMLLKISACTDVASSSETVEEMIE